MSTTLAFRLILGLVVGGVLTCSVWDRNDRELKEQPADEDTRTGMPRFRSFAAAETLPTMLVMYLAISLAIGGREMAVQYLLGLLLRVFLLIGVYYVLLLAVLPLLRRHISARVCAVLWLLPGYLYFLAQVSSVQRADPGGERMLVLHASGTLVTVLLAVWAGGAIGVFAWKIISHLRFRRRVLKDAVVVRDEQTLAVWRAPGSGRRSGRSSARRSSRRRCRSACFRRPPASPFPRAATPRRSFRSSCATRSSISAAGIRPRNFLWSSARPCAGSIP